MLSHLLHGILTANYCVMLIMFASNHNIFTLPEQINQPTIQPTKQPTNRTTNPQIIQRFSKMFRNGMSQNEYGLWNYRYIHKLYTIQNSEHETQSGFGYYFKWKISNLSKPFCDDATKYMYMREQIFGMRPIICMFVSYKVFINATQSHGEFSITDSNQISIMWTVDSVDCRTMDNGHIHVCIEFIGKQN